MTLILFFENITSGLSCKLNMLNILSKIHYSFKYEDKETLILGRPGIYPGIIFGLCLWVQIFAFCSMLQLFLFCVYFQGICFVILAPLINTCIT